MLGNHEIVDLQAALQTAVKQTRLHMIGTVTGIMDLELGRRAVGEPQSWTNAQQIHLIGSHHFDAKPGILCALGLSPRSVDIAIDDLTISRISVAVGTAFGPETGGIERIPMAVDATEKAVVQKAAEVAQ